MGTWSRSFEVTQNSDDTFVLGFASADPSGQLSLATPYNFAGTEVVFTARYTSDPTSTLLVQLKASLGTIVFGTSTVQGAPVATLTFTVPHATSVNFPVGTFYCDLLWEVAGAYSYLAAGPFVVAPSVSR